MTRHPKCPVPPDLQCDCRFCAQADNPLMRRHILGLANLRAGQPPKPVTLKTNPSVSLMMESIARMKACPHWEASSSCGCGNNKCRLGKGRDGIVSLQDCFACLREQDVTSVPRP